MQALASQLTARAGRGAKAPLRLKTNRTVRNESSKRMINISIVKQKRHS
jgi:hypothetical protein